MTNIIKMKSIKRLILVLFMLTTLASLAQKPNIDSLFSVWNDKTAHDTSRLRAINKIAWDGYLNFKPDSAFYYAQLQYDLAKTKGLKKQMADALATQGFVHRIRSNYSEALDYFQLNLKAREEISDGNGIAECLYNIGGIHMEQGEYSSALDYFQRSLTAYEKIPYDQDIINPLLGIGFIYDHQGHSVKAMDYYLRGINLYKKIPYKKGIANIFSNLGYMHMKVGNYSKALDYLHQSLNIYEASNSKYFITLVLHSIAGIYMEQEDLPKALNTYRQILKIEKELSDRKGIANAMVLIGVVCMDQGDSSKALNNLQQGLKIYEEISSKKERAQTLAYIGHYYVYQENYPKALDYIQQSLTIFEEISDYQGTLDRIIETGILQEWQGNQNEAIDRYKKALRLAEKTGSIYHQQEACEYLYDAYKRLGNGNKALIFHEKMLVLTDSLSIVDLAKKIQQMEFARLILADSLSQVAKEQEVQYAHELEVRKKNRTRNYAFGIGLLVLIVAIALYSRLQYTRKAKASIEKEKDRSDNLLLNILPAEIAEELKEKGEAAARDFENVSVLFTDFMEFTKMSEKLTATELVAEINYCFKGFDAICEKYGIEKIKTIGDAYMAAGGLPVSKDDSTKNTVLAALEMAEFIAERRKEREASGLIPFEMRLGIHTGSVVAGIVGQKKFQYDIWGDTVNTASRMENAGEAGKVNISQSTYELIKDDVFTFESRGEIETKGKGIIEMWFVGKVI